MIKIIMFLITFQQLLLGSFLELDQSKFDSIKNMFGIKAVQRVEYIQKEFIKIKQEQFTYTKIYMVNTLINRLLYKKDKVHWQNDRSSTLLEFITSGAGDSLDFATAKYVTLINLGFDKTRFHFFKTDTEGISHNKFDTKDYYVLGYMPKNSSRYVILDCYTDKIMPAFREDLKLKPTQISTIEKNKMEQDMLNINFVQIHQFLQVRIKN